MEPVMEVDEKVQQLLKPMLKKHLFVVISRVVGTQEEMRPHVQKHLEYMNKLEAEGRLFASGPFPQEGITVGDSLTILHAQSFEEAESLIKAEPLTNRGLRTYELRLWELREGRMNITLNASTSSYSL
jgi:uncharacterized protein YciI